MEAADLQTLKLLERWQGGDREALSCLLERDLPWIRQQVRQQLGEGLRRGGDTDDYVQEAVLAVLRYGPRFVLSSHAQFRRLMAKIVLNVLRMKHRELHALKRDVERERVLAVDSILYLDPPQQAVARPDRKAEEKEERERLRLALLMLDPEDQEPIALHWQGLEDREIGERLGISPNTARMRRVRATGRLVKMVHQFNRGELDSLLSESED
ncbi:MAG: hypothetical protein CSA62_01460 [Planctomycetota bacterium]|nr:MAG: hypothetical protein CSA62_01460 [Planctomycetota bacterium]